MQHQKKDVHHLLAVGSAGVLKEKQTDFGTQAGCLARDFIALFRMSVIVILEIETSI
jgi:hypothetical protein